MTSGEAKTDAIDVEKLVDQDALAAFDAKEFVEQMREFITDHSEVTEKIVVYVNDKMKQDILAQLTPEETAEIKLVALADLIAGAE